MVFNKHKQDKQDDEIDPKLIANIVCKRTAKELKDTIINEKNAVELNKQSELLLTTERGYIVDDFTQNDIVESVDVSTATKRMDLSLKYGPYYMDFTRDGRYLSIAGERGQLAMFDWKTKDLCFDMNVKEKIRAVKYLHKETNIAVSQLDYTFIYDNEGKELHSIRQIYRASHLEFLPYHFLLVAGTEKGFIHYLDVSTGKMVADIKTFHGPVRSMCQNQSNAIINTVHTNGTVCMWSPNESSPVMKMLCHATPMRHIAVDNTGNYLATCGEESTIKIWDVRSTQEMLADIRLSNSPSSIEFSQTGMLAVGARDTVRLLKDVHIGCRTMSINDDNFGGNNSKVQPERNVRPLLSHSFGRGDTIRQMRFCPYEDVLGCGLAGGVSTIFAPGAGEPNFDGLESNPYADRKFRNEQEVKRLLEKVPSEMISMVANIASVYRKSVREEWEAERDRMFNVPTASTTVKKTRSKKTRPKPATVKKISTKDNLHFERLKMQQELFKADNVSYKVKKPLSKAPINSVLDKLIYKRL